MAFSLATSTLNTVELLCLLEFFLIWEMIWEMADEFRSQVLPRNSLASLPIIFSTRQHRTSLTSLQFPTATRDQDRSDSPLT